MILIYPVYILIFYFIKFKNLFLLHFKYVQNRTYKRKVSASFKKKNKFNTTQTITNFKFNIIKTMKIKIRMYF